MKNQITIREANSKTDTAAFWEQLRSYHERDIFPNPKDESLKHFLNDAEYRAQIEHVHNRPQDNCYYLFFQRNGQDVGFALPVIFTSEDGKCFIMEFCVYPEFRGNGTGRACAAVLLDWAKARGACYAELNYGGGERRLRHGKEHCAEEQRNRDYPGGKFGRRLSRYLRQSTAIIHLGYTTPFVYRINS